MNNYIYIVEYKFYEDSEIRFVGTNIASAISKAFEDKCYLHVYNNNSYNSLYTIYDCSDFSIKQIIENTKNELPPSEERDKFINVLENRYGIFELQKRQKEIEDAEKRKQKELKQLAELKAKYES
jgi:hypothetical protein